MGLGGWETGKKEVLERNPVRRRSRRDHAMPRNVRILCPGRMCEGNVSSTTLGPLGRRAKNGVRDTGR